MRTKITGAVAAMAGLAALSMPATAQAAPETTAADCGLSRVEQTINNCRPGPVNATITWISSIQGEPGSSTIVCLAPGVNTVFHLLGPFRLGTYLLEHDTPCKPI
ncbi:hypothetical protein CFN78_17680 [Amycolatopsis antarctica]|uniref:Ig-like domain-containing protein n=1 Tax=Amycolatopsis antarctica TaxID=1854586 RepID=A0A263D0K7_9PSEU|nr:hypothetical protein [Amycolatopsis antarctica]OZM71970.1 hypothetical protein CFN78_17680 [Amycolatopsis antarctica]